MSERLAVNKTYKLWIGGKFPRSESGRSIAVQDEQERVLAHICHASRKDLRGAIEAAAKALPGWSGATAYLRGQILYRMAEMLEGRTDEFVRILRETTGAKATDARREVAASIDRLVRFAGWTDKFQQIMGGQNAIAGPYYNFTVPQPTGIVGIVAPDEPGLLGFVTLMAAPLCAGNTCVVIASDTQPLPAAVFGEVCATSDLPGGAVNILTGSRAELIEPLATHREVRAISGSNLPRAMRTALRMGAAENVKRVHVDRRSADAWYDDDACASPWSITPFVEMKTIWHPSAM